MSQAIALPVAPATRLEDLQLLCADACPQCGGGLGRQRKREDPTCRHCDPALSIGEAARLRTPSGEDQQGWLVHGRPNSVPGTYRLGHPALGWAYAQPHEIQAVSAASRRPMRIAP